MEKASYPDCPKCGLGRLAPAGLELFERARDGEEARGRSLHLDQCGNCGGVWFDPDELDEYMDHALTALNSPGRLDREGQNKPIDCLRCRTRMAKLAPSLFSGVVADICPKCFSAWLDPGELDRMERGTLAKIAGTFLGAFFPGRKDRWSVRSK